VGDALNLFPVAVDSLPIGVVIVDPDGRIAFVSRELERQFGYSRRELLGRVVEMLVPKGLSAALDEQRLASMTAPGGGARRELFGLRRDGSRFPIEVGLSSIETDQAVLEVASVVDISMQTGIERAASPAADDQIEFERLVTDISLQFINLPLEQMDEAIRRALGRVCPSFDVDRSQFYRIQSDGAWTDPISWERPGIPALQGPVLAAERLPWALGKELTGELVCFSNLDEVPSAVDRATYCDMGIKSTVAVPLSVAGKLVGAIDFNAVRRERSWEPQTLHRMRVIASAFGNVLARRQSEETLRQALADVERLRDRLHIENVYLRREADERLGTGVIVGHSPGIQRVLEQSQQVACTDSTVLLLGETGVGKELFATQIHQQSARRGRAMVRVNCSAIPATLIESELFGREKGAFTGALSRQVGRFELADHSTIFLDEIGDLPLDVQVKLLRVLEERQIERLGSPRTIHVDVRIIAATHRNLEESIADGSFREDLFYRLNVFPIFVPPLRERSEDLPLLVWRFVDELSKALGKRIDAIPRETMEALQRYAWPGNIRELRNVVERAMIVATGRRLTIPLPSSTSTDAGRSERLVDVDKAHIRSVLDAVGWRIRGTGGAADRLGMKPTTLETRMARYGLRRPGQH
jgi:formate hydrogenlyase transcriptional activator